MTTWIDIGVVRIQRYLSRTDRLIGRRSGSALLTDTMRSSDIVSSLAAAHRDLDVETHTAAGDADGVLHLVVTGDADDEALRDLVATALHEVRRRLPGAELEATWARGDTYANAAPILAERRLRNDVMTSLPSMATVPFARRCDFSGVDTAREMHRVNRADRAVGADMHARLLHEERRRAAGAARGAHERLPSVADLPAARDLNAVAATTTRSPHPAISKLSNHLATLYIDGNAMGAFFSAAATHSGVDKDALSSAATASMVTAVDSALAALVDAMSHDDEANGAESDMWPTPFEVHVLGGDDVLVTVPGAFGIETARRIIATFSDQMSAAVSQHAPQLVDTAPTASAGVVIAHQSYPLSTVVDLGAELLARAKRETRGRLASMSWTDVTRYGHHIDDRPTVTSTDLEDLRGDVERVRELGKSAQVILAQAAQHPEPAIATARAFNEFHRRRRPDLAHLADDPARLSSLLDLVRWWFE